MSKGFYRSSGYIRYYWLNKNVYNQIFEKDDCFDSITMVLSKKYKVCFYPFSTSVSIQSSEQIGHEMCRELVNEILVDYNRKFRERVT